MNILEITHNKKDYLDLLLIGDEQEDMIDKYINRSRMFALDDNGIKAVCALTDEGNDILEIKNISVYPQYQRNGFGKTLIKFIENKFKGSQTRVEPNSLK